MATCPFCDYTGSWRSVEGHVSGSTDGDHAGKLGRQYRERIKETVGDDDPEVQGVEKATPPTPLEGSGEGSSESGPSVQVEESEGVGPWQFLAATGGLVVGVLAASATSTPDPTGSEAPEGQASGVDESERSAGLAGRWE